MGAEGRVGRSVRIVAEEPEVVPITAFAPVVIPGGDNLSVGLNGQVSNVTGGRGDAIGSERQVLVQGGGEVGRSGDGDRLSVVVDVVVDSLDGESNRRLARGYGQRRWNGSLGGVVAGESHGHWIGRVGGASDDDGGRVGAGSLGDRRFQDGQGQRACVVVDDVDSGGRIWMSGGRGRDGHDLLAVDDRVVSCSQVEGEAGESVRDGHLGGDG